MAIDTGLERTGKGRHIHNETLYRLEGRISMKLVFIIVKTNITTLEKQEEVEELYCLRWEAVMSLLRLQIVA